MSPDRPSSPDAEQTAVASSPEILADEMADATKRLRERAWMISAHSVRAVHASSAGTAGRGRAGKTERAARTA